MNERENQIEEMANIIAFKAFEQAHYVDGDENLADIVATDLYEKGCRIIPEGAIILTKEERAALNAYQKKLDAGGDPFEKE